MKHKLSTREWLEYQAELKLARKMVKHISNQLYKKGNFAFK